MYIIKEADVCHVTNSKAAKTDINLTHQFFFNWPTVCALHMTDVHCVQRKSGPPNKLLYCKKNLSDLAEILDM